jgi:hypothetical protein
LWFVGWLGLRGGVCCWVWLDGYFGGTPGHDVCDQDGESDDQVEQFGGGFVPEVEGWRAENIEE